MGLFSRKKKNQNFDPREQYVPEVVYDEDLTTTLVKTIGIGSKDAKRVTVQYEDETLSYYFDSGSLSGVSSDKTLLNLSQRFYWVDTTSYDAETLEKIVSLANNNDLFDFYRALKIEFPEHVDFISEILYKYCFQLMVSHYNDEIKSVNLDLLDDDEDRKVRDFTVMNIDAESIGKEIEKELLSQKEDLAAVTNSDLSITTLRIVDKSFVPQNDVQRIVWLAADSLSSLEDIQQLSQGFLWSEILDSVNELNYMGRIEVVDPSDVDKESEPLPDLDIFLEESPVETVSAEVEETEEEIEPVSDYDIDSSSEDPLSEDPFAELEEWEYAAPKVENDDGDFAYEQEPEEELSVTQHVLDSFEAEVMVDIALGEHERDFIKEVSALLKSNRELEEKTAELDKVISPLQANYDNRFTKFQHLSAASNIAGEDADIDQNEIDQLRELSNRSFRELYDLEEERFEIGKTRKSVLKDLEKALHSLQSENTQEFIYRVTQKIDAMDNTVNLAYHTPKDDENLNIDPNLIVSAEPSPKDTPMFQKLMKQYGDPFKSLTH